MNKPMEHMVTAALIATLAGCGGSGKTDGSSGGNAAGAAAAAEWDATDACSLLDKGVLGAALKDTVTEASVGLVHEASGPEAATSDCTYILAGGGRASLLSRNSPIADNSAEAIALARKTTQEAIAPFTDKKVEDVPGLGKAAFFVPGINQMNVFLDDRRFVILTIGTAPNDTAKATAVDLIAKLKK
ncbi:MAG: hypothetical protein ACKOPO_10555 [Novosphingobium sp.]